MAHPTLLPTGQLHPDLVNNAAFVKYVNGGGANAQSGPPAARIQGPSASELQQFTERLNQKHREGKLDIVDLTPLAVQHGSGSTTDGKKIIDNSGSCGLVVGFYDPSVFTADDANRSAAAGGATHGFFYRETDFLLDAAKEYAKLGENEVFKFRDIHDAAFVRDTLDFFTNGNYTQADVSAVQRQMDGIVRELAQQIKNGETPDIGKLQGKLTINGTDTTVSQLMEMQKTGRELSEYFSGMTSGSLNAKNTEAFAQMGLAKSFGNCYGSTRGELGRQFSDAMDRLYEKGKVQVRNTEAWAKTVSRGANTPGHQAAVRTELKIADLFAGLDASNKSSLAGSFSTALSQARSAVKQYCSQYGLTTSYVGLAGATNQIAKFFQSWMDRL